MSLRDWIILAFAPSCLPGIRAGDWLRLLRENRFRIDPRYGVRAASISTFSLFNSAVGWYEEQKYGSQIRETVIQQPVFILGHWRSGTTFLQNLFSLDPRFASPTLCEVLFPHTFLTTERLLRRLFSAVVPASRRSDDVRFGLDVPYEDELAICAISLCSHHVSAVFPHRSEHYDQYVTLRDLTGPEVARWRMALTHFLRKISFKYQRPLVLKSPAHTARVRFLLEMFPNARFLHIHRDPYVVYQSILRVAMESSRWQRLQRPTAEEIGNRIIRIYRQMYDAFFEDRGRIPTMRFHEIRFEHLERDAVGELRRAYESLDLPSFEEIEPDVRRYLTSIARFRKHSYEPLPEPLRGRIAQEWGRCFREWRYPE